jgi:hypothetical protein
MSSIASSGHLKVSIFCLSYKSLGKANIDNYARLGFVFFQLFFFFFAYCLQLQDTKTTTGETELKFQVSRDTLGSMLRSMAYIREQL